MAEIHVGNKVMFRYTLVDQDDAVVNVSSATTKQLIFKSPHGTRYVYPASFTTNGSDGVLEKRVTQPSPAGRWKAEIYIEGVAGFDGYSEIDQFSVLNPL